MPEYVRPHLRILVVEDDQVASLFMKDYLEHIGDCDFAQDGTSAIRMFSDALDDVPYDLVCLDIGLPDLSGKSVLTEMREREKNKGMDKEELAIIIMTTAAGEIKDVLQAMHLGCDGYVVKPFTRENLYTELNKTGISVDWQEEDDDEEF